jgi:uncharacterized caspase-like protein
MRSSRLILVLLLLAIPLASPRAARAAEAGTKWALLIGVDDYQDPDISDLRYSSRDVDALADTLIRTARYPEDQVVRLTTAGGAASQPTQVAVLKRLDFLAKKVGPNDTFLFYFSGHGFSRPGNRNYLGTVNTDPTTLETLELTTVPLSRLRQKIGALQANKVVFVIDACRNDPEKGKGDTPNVRSEPFARDLVLAASAAAAGQAGAAILFACSEGQRAYEWPEKQHGVFTYYLVDGLQGKAADASGQVTVNSLAEYLQNRVGRWSAEQNKAQLPDLEQKGAARILLAQVAKPTPSAPGGSAAGLSRLDLLTLQLQKLLQESGTLQLRNLTMAQRVVLSEHAICVFVRWTSESRAPLPPHLVRRLLAPLRALDPARIEVEPTPRFDSTGAPAFRVMVPTRDGSDSVLWDLVDKPDGRRPVWHVLFRGEDTAKKAAGILKELLTLAASTGEKEGGS